ncbi:MAG: aspartate--tRNA(Asn) ligase, partial [Candidatus Blackburnbacteria bacterium]|nr:aspartate--tRNA(Asn) ligase [Candidatus Blackburnbacteria bacterium]
MERTLALETTKKVGKEVLLKGWVNTRRDHGKLVFIDLRDRSGIVQVVGGQELGDLRPEDVVEITGTVNRRPANLVNPKIPTGEVEVKASKVGVLAKAQELPFDMGQEALNVSLPTLLDYRPLTLRHPKVQAIFKIQETLIDSFRETLKNMGFAEFQAPAIVPVATEGGAEIFPVKYYDHTVYLGQSPQLYKQMMVGIFERVFTVGKAYRAEPSVTTRHLSEYITLDAEFGFVKSWEEIPDVAEHLIKTMLKAVSKNNKKELEMYGAKVPEFSGKLPRLKLREAQEVIFKRTKRDIRREPDLSPDDEKEICTWAQEERGSDLVIITHYPT